FDFDKGVSFRHPAPLIAIIEMAEKIHATRMIITGVRGAHKLSNGSVLRESDDIGRRRAEEVAALLQGAGLKLPTITHWIAGDAEADGIDDWQSRRVTVELLP
ncbi:MAG TPA: hypothetical protein VMH83_16100, partial [Candidatus Acidoferrum sp.]|nr:hypothetical protein [Candidatus Acidoferrum sp.]